MTAERWILARLRNHTFFSQDRTGRRATRVTSQLPLEHWHQTVGDTTLADAILDRLVHHAHRITLKGDSMRRNKPDNDPPQTATA